MRVVGATDLTTDETLEPFDSIQVDSFSNKVETLVSVYRSYSDFFTAPYDITIQLYNGSVIKAPYNTKTMELWLRRTNILVLERGGEKRSLPLRSIFNQIDTGLRQLFKQEEYADECYCEALTGRLGKGFAKQTEGLSDGEEERLRQFFFKFPDITLFLYKYRKLLVLMADSYYDSFSTEPLTATHSEGLSDEIRAQLYAHILELEKQMDSHQVVAGTLKRKRASLATSSSDSEKPAKRMRSLEEDYGKRKGKERVTLASVQDPNPVGKTLGTGLFSLWGQVPIASKNTDTLKDQSEKTIRLLGEPSVQKQDCREALRAAIRSPRMTTPLSWDDIAASDPVLSSISSACSSP